MAKFNPEDYGFNTAFNNKFCNRKRKPRLEKSYIKASMRKDGSTSNLMLIFDWNTYNLVLKTLGKTVDFAVDDHGRILLYKGASRKVSEQGQTQGRVSISSARDVLFSKFGEFKRLYMNSELFADENAILFTPTDEWVM